MIMMMMIMMMMMMMMHFLDTIFKLLQCQNISNMGKKSNFIVLAAILEAIFLFI